MAVETINVVMHSAEDSGPFIETECIRCVCVSTPVGLHVSASCSLEVETLDCIVLLPGLHQYWTPEFKGRVAKSQHTMPEKNKLLSDSDSLCFPVKIPVCLHSMSHSSASAFYGH